MKISSVLVEAIEAKKMRKEKEALGDAKQKLLKTHKEIGIDDIDDIMKKIDNGEFVEITRCYYFDFNESVKCDIVNFHSVQMKRKVYKMRYELVSRAYIHSYLLDTPNLFYKV